MNDIAFKFPSIVPNRNYRLASDPARVFTGQQMRNLLAIAEPVQQAMLLLDVLETEQPATNPASEYGIE